VSPSLTASWHKLAFGLWWSGMGSKGMGGADEASHSRFLTQFLSAYKKESAFREQAY